MAHRPGPGYGGKHGQEHAGRVASPWAPPRGPSGATAWATRGSCGRASATRPAGVGTASEGSGPPWRGGTRRPSRSEPHEAASPAVTRWRPRPRWGETSGTGPRRAARKEREEVVLASRHARRQQRAPRPPAGRRQRPAVSLAAPCVPTPHAGPFPG
jgi:hypothetical protein